MAQGSSLLVQRLPDCGSAILESMSPHYTSHISTLPNAQFLDVLTLGYLQTSPSPLALKLPLQNFYHCFHSNQQDPSGNIKEQKNYNPSYL